jgi:ATP-dependent DNA helicase RecG
VAEAFYLTGNIEKYGSGFIRIRKALRDYPELSLSAQEISGGIMLTFAQVKVEQLESQPESLAERVLEILADGTMAKKDISDRLGQKEVSGQLNKIVRDLLAEAMIEPTIPDKPNSRHQRYRITQAGQVQLLNQKAKHK